LRRRVANDLYKSDDLTFISNRRQFADGPQACAVLSDPPTFVTAAAERSRFFHFASKLPVLSVLFREQHVQSVP
jgi:hypothetical protein